MAITRRQFVTRLGALAAAAGFSQVEASKIMDAMAYDDRRPAHLLGTFGKPRVVWIHGAECTGCSTSLLGFFEDANGEALDQTGVTTATALTDAGVIPFTARTSPYNSSSTPLLKAARLEPRPQLPSTSPTWSSTSSTCSITRRSWGTGGDWPTSSWPSLLPPTATPFVLVVEGALQRIDQGGAWNDSSGASELVPWCAIGHADNPAGGEINMSALVSAAC